MKFSLARPSTSTRAVVAAGTAGLLVVGVGAVGVLMVRDGDSAPDVAEAERVLQSVSATVGSDGTITALDGTVVAVASDGSSSTSTTEYSPKDMAQELPVRVRTSYRTAEGSGTDLDDLEGHDGRVEIALTVENLTVEPQELTYDVAGTQRTRSALVGVPLSISASTSLGDLDPASVVTTDGAGASADDATNGVLSRTESGDTQVQWATILAPPQLGTTATLRLVVDAEDFSAPDFDLSVQQGLVTDPSLGALVDAAFNPASSEELALQQRTISLIGEVNTVIARAGQSITDVRRTLRTSAETIGEQTVSDLQSSTRSIAQSMAALGQAVDSLGTDLSSTLEATSSTAVQQLQQSVAGIDALLGDTSQAPPTARVTGAGCETTVALPSRGSSLYGSLLSVSSQLDGYAGATAACKGFVQQRLIDTIGSDDRSTACLDANGDRVPEEQQSVTCTLFEVAQEFGDITRDLAEQRDVALDAIDGLGFDELKSSADGLSAEVLAVQAAAADLRDPDALDDAIASLSALEGELGAFTTGLADIRSRALQQAATVGGGDDSIADQVQSIRAGVCDLDTLELVERDAVAVQLTGSTCAGVPVPLSNPLSQRVDAQEAAWNEIADLADVDGGGSGLGESVGDAVSAAAALRTALVDGVEIPDPDGGTPTRQGGVDRLLGDLTTAVGALEAERADVATKAEEISGEIGTRAVPRTDDPGTAEDESQLAPIPGTGLLGTVENAFNEAGQGASEQIDDAVAQQSVRLVRQTAEDATDIGAAFERSAAGLTAAGRTVRTDAKATIDKQRSGLATSSKRSEQALTASVQNGLQQIERGVTASTRDTEAASTLLQADLRNVLLDLGVREVDGSGLLGSMATSAATAGSADFQLAQATDTTTSFAGVRDSSVAGLYLRQAQADAAFALQAAQPTFGGLDIPSSASHRTVYTFHVRTGS